MTGIKTTTWRGGICPFCKEPLSKSPYSMFFIEGKPKRTRAHIWCFEGSKKWDPSRLTNVGVLP